MFFWAVDAKEAGWALWSLDLRGLLHFYYYNELHSSDYYYYDATYIYIIREKFDLQIYHI